MVAFDVEERPTAGQLLQHRFLCPWDVKTKYELRKELAAERMRSEILAKQLEDATKCIKTIQHARPESPLVSKMKTRSSRLVGRKINRSKSIQDF